MVNAPRRRALALVSVAVAVTTAVAACGSSSSSPSGAPTSSAAPVAPASIDSLVTQSKTENALTIYANIPTDLFKPIVDAFSAQYPWIKVDDQDVGDFEIFSKVGAEQGQGSPSADVLISTYPTGFLSANKRGLLKTDYSPAGLENFPSFARQGPGTYVMEVDPVLMGYNTKLIDAAHAPHSLADLAALAQQGMKLTTYSITHPIGYGGVWANVTKHGEAAWQTLAKLGPATTVIDEGNLQLEGVIKGQFAAGYFSSGLGRAFVPKFGGLFAMNYTNDLQVLIPRGMAIASKAAHSASAQLFMDFVYSMAGQNVLCDAGLTAFINNFKSSTGCTTSLADIQAHVSPANIFVVPFSQKLLDDQAAITERWRTLFTQ